MELMLCINDKTPLELHNTCCRTGKHLRSQLYNFKPHHSYWIATCLIMIKHTGLIFNVFNLYLLVIIRDKTPKHSDCQLAMLESRSRTYCTRGGANRGRQLMFWYNISEQTGATFLYCQLVWLPIWYHSPNLLYSKWVNLFPKTTFDMFKPLSTRKRLMRG